MHKYLDQVFLLPHISKEIDLSNRELYFEFVFSLRFVFGNSARNVSSINNFRAFYWLGLNVPNDYKFPPKKPQERTERLSLICLKRSQAHTHLLQTNLFR